MPRLGRPRKIVTPQNPIKSSTMTAFGETPTVILDAEQVFMLYATFAGDVERTAHAAGITLNEVFDLVEKNQWAQRLRGLLDLKKTDKAGDIERGISRAINFIQAHRYRIVLERIIQNLYTKSAEELIDFLSEPRLNKAREVIGTTFNSRMLADIATAMEKVHWLTYQALEDSPSERERHAEDVKAGGDIAEADLHARIAKGLAEMRRSPAQALQEGQAIVAAGLVGRPELAPPSSPSQPSPAAPLAPPAPPAPPAP